MKRPASLLCGDEPVLARLRWLAVSFALVVATVGTVSAVADSLEGWRAGGSACATFPPRLERPRLFVPVTRGPAPRDLQFSVSRREYEDFLRRYREFAAAPRGGAGGGCCGLLPEAPMLVVAEFEIDPPPPPPDTPGDVGSTRDQLSVVATLLPFGNTLLSQQDSLVIAMLHRLVRSGLFGRVSLHQFVQQNRPDLLDWIGQSHLFCLTQHYDRPTRRALLRLVVTRPLNPLEWRLGPLSMRFRLAPCQDASDDDRRAALFSATVRLPEI